MLKSFATVAAMSFLAALILTTSAPAPAWAQSDQDGLGRVEYDDASAPAEEVAPRQQVEVPPRQQVVTPRSEAVRATPPRSRNGQPIVGRKAAEKYMAPKKQIAETVRERSIENHIMTVHIGSSVNDHAWKWGGNDRISDSAKFNLGLSYRFGEWTNVADFFGAVEYTTFSLRGRSVQKLSLLPKISFPDVSSHFPLYFGLGAGLGIFTKQLSGESALSFDYQFFAGLRFLNIFPNTGFFAETGLKSHFLLLSDGQFNGWFLSIGAIFAF